mgnify:CR=1 FL=1
MARESEEAEIMVEKKTRVDERHFRRGNVFEGNEMQWTDWVFQFKTQVRSADQWAGAILDKLQEKAGDPDWETFQCG